MATGYTHPVLEGQSFKDFALHCACAFFYDTTRLPETFDEDPYYASGIEAARLALERLESLTEEVAQKKYGESKIADRIRSAKQILTEKRTAIDRLIRMIVEVEAWDPPTEFANLKNFMLQQLRETLEVDGDIKWLEREVQSAGFLRPLEVFKSDLESARGRLQSAQKNLNEHRMRNAERRKWVEALKRSLG